MGDFFAFLRCGTDHHTINLIDLQARPDEPHRFELRDWTHVETALSTTYHGTIVP